MVHHVWVAWCFSRHFKEDRIKLDSLLRSPHRNTQQASLLCLVIQVFEHSLWIFSQIYNQIGNNSIKLMACIHGLFPICLSDNQLMFLAPLFIWKFTLTFFQNQFQPFPSKLDHLRWEISGQIGWIWVLEVNNMWHKQTSAASYLKDVFGWRNIHHANKSEIETLGCTVMLNIVITEEAPFHFDLIDGGAHRLAMLFHILYIMRDFEIISYMGYKELWILISLEVTNYLHQC